MYDEGQKSIRETLSMYRDGVFMSPDVGSNLHIEPIPIKDIKRFSDYYPYFISEVFHGKLVGLWNNCLTDIFSLFVDLHLTGKRDFKELKKLNIKLDFSLNENFNSHIKNRIIDAFDFNKKYSKRQKLINKILNPNKEGNEELDNILKNVLIRNVIQHRNNIVDSHILKELGSTQIKVLDMAGKSKIYKEDDKILLTIPEIYSFKSSIFIIGQIWRVKDE